MVASEGMLGLWRGLGPTVFRDVPFSGIYWAVYESFKAHNGVTVPTFWITFFGGAIAGSVSLPTLLITLKVFHSLPFCYLFTDCRPCDGSI